MQQRYTFEGQYTRQGNTYLSNDGIRLIYSERSHSKPNKPKSFLLFTDNEGKERKYFSGLFPKGSNTYKADHQGIEYTVSITSDCITIQKQGS